VLSLVLGADGGIPGNLFELFVERLSKTATPADNVMPLASVTVPGLACFCRDFFVRFIVGLAACSGLLPTRSVVGNAVNATVCRARKPDPLA
jgi:hypothetical protein